jgi:hypothetical protein
VNSSFFHENIQILTWDVTSATNYFEAQGSGFASAPATTSFLHNAEKELKLLSPDYAHLETEASRFEYIAAAFKGLIGIKMQPIVEVEAAVLSFYTRYTSLDPDLLLTTASNVPTCNTTAATSSAALSQGRLNFSALTLDMISTEALFAYDATISLARALHFLLYESVYKSSLKEGKDIVPSMIKGAFSKNVLSFAGVTGHLQYDEEASRSVDIEVEVYNFHPEEYLSSVDKTNRLLLSDYELGYMKVGTQHTENGFSVCSANVSACCRDFVYNSEDGEVVSDRPTLVTLVMSHWASALLRFFSVVGIVVAMVHAYLIWYYEHSRLVRVAQPFLSLLILIGCVFSFITAIHMSVRKTNEMGATFCPTLSWFQNIAFLFVLVPLFMKKLRINLILSASTHLVAAKNRYNISNRQGNIVVITMIAFGILLQLLSNFVICGEESLEYTTLRDDQSEYSQEASCPAFKTNSSQALCHLEELYTGVIIFLCVVLCFYHNRSDFVVEEADACLRGVVFACLFVCLFVPCAALHCIASHCIIVFMYSSNSYLKIMYVFLFGVVVCSDLHLRGGSRALHSCGTCI